MRCIQKANNNDSNKKHCVEKKTEWTNKRREKKNIRKHNNNILVNIRSSAQTAHTERKERESVANILNE